MISGPVDLLNDQSRRCDPTPYPGCNAYEVRRYIPSLGSVCLGYPRLVVLETTWGGSDILINQGVIKYHFCVHSFSEDPPKHLKLIYLKNPASLHHTYTVMSYSDVDYSGMKRGADRDMGSPQKRARNLGYELRILIPSRVAGSIIGKGGSNISRLRSENKATISVPDCPGPERLITISSDDQDVTFGVLSQIVPLIEDASKDRNRAADGDVVEVRLLYHHTQVGCIIGKAGVKIKELRETTSTQIKVYGICCPRSTDRVVGVTGPTEMVLNAVKQIALLVQDNPVKGTCDPYDPHHFDDVYAAQYGGFGEGDGRGGYGGERGYGGRGSSVGGSRMGGGGGPRGGMRGGYREDRGPRGGGGGGGGGGGSGGGMSGGPYHDPNYGMGSNGGRHDDYEPEYGDEDRQTTQVTIPKEYAGAIIGKGGSRIRRIRADSGANITIDEALPGAADRIITISGGSGQIRMAQYLLQQSLDMRTQGERYYGEQQRRCAVDWCVLVPCIPQISLGQPVPCIPQFSVGQPVVPCIPQFNLGQPEQAL